jgi:hypothetical protein
LCGAFLALFGLAVGPGHAQAPSGDIIYTRQPTFRIPFEVDAVGPRLREVQLYVSTDLGRLWNYAARTAPAQLGFDFRAERDGLYWFTVRTVDVEGRAYPLTLENARPGLKVYVDTAPQQVFVRPLPGREGLVGVEWEVRDETLDLRTLRIDYRVSGRGAWLPLTIDTTPSGQRTWQVGTTGTVEVRLSIHDRAGNPREATTTVNAAADHRVADAGAVRSASPAANANVRMVNSKRLSLNYEVKDAGPSGVSAVQLWYTQDGRSWQMYKEEREAKPPLVFDVHGEGLYGFTLVIRSGVGLGDSPPQMGDPPQVWVEVDLTKPFVQVLNVDVGRGSETGNLTVSWRAVDKNLAAQPITLSYAERKEGPWTKFAKDLENTGRYVWRMEQNVPFKCFIRVEAADKAGNIGSADWEKVVLVDLAQPKGHILDVGPASKP